MAANLLDTIRQNSAALATQQAPVTAGAGSVTGQTAGLLSAKSGKDTTGTGEYGMSNLGEQENTTQANTAMRAQVAPEQQIQQQGLDTAAATQQQGFQQQQAQLGQARQSNTLQANIQLNSGLADLERQKGEIDMASNRAGVDQVATTLRLQNNQYVENLQLEGQKARLGDQLEFQKNLAGTIFGDKLDIVQKQLGDRSVLDANQQQFSKAMAGMSIDAANAILTREIQAQKQAGVYTSVGGATVAGASAYGKLSEKNSQGGTPTPESPGSEQTEGQE